MQHHKAWKQMLGISMVAALFGGAAAHAQTAQGTTDAASKGSTTSNNASLSQADQKLLTEMAIANMAEIENAKLAQSKGQSDQVKKFAQQMIDDHTKALNDVQQLAQSKNVTLPSTLDRKHKAEEDRLARLSGDAFDRAYIKQAGVSDHKQVHGELRKIASRARDPDLKALASRILPTVDQHLATVQQMQGAKGGTKSGRSSTGSTSSGGSQQGGMSSGSGQQGSKGSSGTSGTSGGSNTSGSSQQGTTSSGTSSQGTSNSGYNQQPDNKQPDKQDSKQPDKRQ